MQLTLMHPIIPHFCEYFLHLPLYSETILQPLRKEFNNKCDMNVVMEILPKGRFHLITPADNYNRVITTDLRWIHRYSVDVSSIISKRLASRKKQKITNVTIYVADEITDPYEQLAYQIYSDRIIEKISTSLTPTEIVTAGKQYNPSIMEDDKSTNLLIRSYKRIEELVNVYGNAWFQRRIKGEISEYDVLVNYLTQYYLKLRQEDAIVVTVVKYNKKCESEKEKIDGVKINEPVIRYG